MTPHNTEGFIWLPKIRQQILRGECRFDAAGHEIDYLYVTPPLSTPDRNDSRMICHFEVGALITGVIAVILYCCSLRIIQRRAKRTTGGIKHRADICNVGSGWPFVSEFGGVERHLGYYV